MLGGSFWIALLRNAMGAVMIMGIFLLLDRPRFPMKKMVLYYGLFGNYYSNLKILFHSEFYAFSFLE